jgi:hypothetical protein
MSRETPDVLQQGGRWLRVGILTLTMAGPALNSLLAWMRQRSQEVNTHSADLQESAHDASSAARQQIDDFTRASRQRMAAQVSYLQQQAGQVSSQTAQLRAALRREKRQRRELDRMLSQLRAAGINWSQELLKRGEDVTEDLLAQGGKISSDLLERGSEVSHELVARGEQLLRGGRRRNGAFWTILGFSAGLVAAASATYLLIRSRLLRRQTEQDGQIELPPNQALQGRAPGARPAGTIRHIDGAGNSVTSLQQPGNAEQNAAVPADAAFVGVVRTKQYFPITAIIEGVEAEDVVFFTSEEEAQSEGFSAATAPAE